jgi:hypothetical protein
LTAEGKVSLFPVNENMVMWILLDSLQLD